MHCAGLGPGIPNLALAIRDGFSTCGSAGGGLGAIQRLCHSFDVYSSSGRGVVLLARMEKGDPSRARKTVFPSTGAISIAKEGEEICGDSWKVRRLDGGFSLLVVDGLGHGPFAADAARAAVRAYDATNGQAVVTAEELELRRDARDTKALVDAFVDVDAGAELAGLVGLELVGQAHLHGVVLDDMLISPEPFLFEILPVIGELAPLYRMNVDHVPGDKKHIGSDDQGERTALAAFPQLLRHALEVAAAVAFEKQAEEVGPSHGQLGKGGLEQLRAALRSKSS